MGTTTTFMWVALVLLALSAIRVESVDVYGCEHRDSPKNWASKPMYFARTAVKFQIMKGGVGLNPAIPKMHGWLLVDAEPCGPLLEHINLLTGKFMTEGGTTEGGMNYAEQWRLRGCPFASDIPSATGEDRDQDDAFPAELPKARHALYRRVLAWLYAMKFSASESPLKLDIIPVLAPELPDNIPDDIEDREAFLSKLDRETNLQNFYYIPYVSRREAYWIAKYALPLMGRALGYSGYVSAEDHYGCRPEFRCQISRKCARAIQASLVPQLAESRYARGVLNHFVKHTVHTKTDDFKAFWEGQRYGAGDVTTRVLGTQALQQEQDIVRYHGPKDFFRNTKAKRKWAVCWDLTYRFRSSATALCKHNPELWTRLKCDQAQNTQGNVVCGEVCPSLPKKKNSATMQPPPLQPSDTLRYCVRHLKNLGEYHWELLVDVDAKNVVINKDKPLKLPDLVKLWQDNINDCAAVGIPATVASSLLELPYSWVIKNDEDMRKKLESLEETSTEDISDESDDETVRVTISDKQGKKIAPQPVPIERGTIKELDD